MKKVTLQMIADRAGISVSGACNGIKRGSPRILKIAQELGYKTRKERNADRMAEQTTKEADYRAELDRKAEVRKHKVITCRTIAQDIGCHYHTVERVLCKHLPVSESLAATIREYAEKVGYVPVTKSMAKRARFLEEIGFGTAEQLEEHMKMLRERGYTNAEIAKKCGVSYNTALLYIGKQPKEYTAESMRIAGEYAKAKNAARKSRLKNFKAAEGKRIDAAIEQTEADNVIHLKQIEENNKYIAELQARKAAL